MKYTNGSGVIHNDRVYGSPFMFVNAEIKEARIQESMATHAYAVAPAERQYSKSSL